MKNWIQQIRIHKIFLNIFQTKNPEVDYPQLEWNNIKGVQKNLIFDILFFKISASMHRIFKILVSTPHKGRYKNVKAEEQNKNSKLSVFWHTFNLSCKPFFMDYFLARETIIFTIIKHPVIWFLFQFSKILACVSILYVVKLWRLKYLGDIFDLWLNAPLI